MTRLAGGVFMLNVPMKIDQNLWKRVAVIYYGHEIPAADGDFPEETLSALISISAKNAENKRRDIRLQQGVFSNANEILFDGYDISVPLVDCFQQACHEKGEFPTPVRFLQFLYEIVFNRKESIPPGLYATHLPAPVLGPPEIRRGEPMTVGPSLAGFMLACGVVPPIETLPRLFIPVSKKDRDKALIPRLFGSIPKKDQGEDLIQPQEGEYLLRTNGGVLLDSINSPLSRYVRCPDVWSPVQWWNERWRNLMNGMSNDGEFSSVVFSPTFLMCPFYHRKPFGDDDDESSRGVNIYAESRSKNLYHILAEFAKVCLFWSSDRYADIPENLRVPIKWAKKLLREDLSETHIPDDSLTYIMLMKNMWNRRREFFHVRDPFHFYKHSEASLFAHVFYAAPELFSLLPQWEIAELAKSNITTKADNDLFYLFAPSDLNLSIRLRRGRYTDYNKEPFLAPLRVLAKKLGQEYFRTCPKGDEVRSPVISGRYMTSYKAIPLEDILNFQTLSTIIQNPNTGAHETILQVLIDQSAPSYSNILTDIFAERRRGVEHAARILAYITSPQWPRISDSLWFSVYGQLRGLAGRRVCEALLADTKKHSLLLRPLALPSGGIWEKNRPPRPLDIILYILLWTDNSYTPFGIASLLSSFSSLLVEPVLSREDFHVLFNHYKNCSVVGNGTSSDFVLKPKPLVTHLARHIYQGISLSGEPSPLSFQNEISVDVSQIEKNISYGAFHNKALLRVLRQAVNSPETLRVFQKVFPSLVERLAVFDAANVMEPVDFNDNVFLTI